MLTPMMKEKSRVQITPQERDRRITGTRDDPSRGEKEQLENVNAQDRERQDELRILTEEEQDAVTHHPESYDTSDQVNGAENNESGYVNRYPQRERKQTTFFSPERAHVATVHVNDEEPSTLGEALSSKEGLKWREAIKSELESLSQHNVWYPSEVPHGMKPLPTRFVFQRKRDSSGNVIRYKARLVVKGYLQGVVEYTYAPVVDFTTVRVALAIGIQKGYCIHQLDIRTAFLHGDIDEEVYVKPPEGISASDIHSCMKLRKSLYGLKQAPRLWHHKWRDVMSQMKFYMLSADHCVFFKDDIYILLYVDDIIIMSKTLHSMTNVKAELTQHLDVKDMGELKTFLGITFTRRKNGAWLSQSDYVEKILGRFGMKSCKSVSTPIISGNNMLTKHRESPVISPLRYQEIIGCLLFLSTRTRPDISLAVGILCRFASAPNAEHWVQLKRVLRYLSGTIDYGLWFDESEGDLVSYCDADWAGSSGDRKSTSGVLIKLGNSPICWKTMKQNCEALSTTEAEYISMSEAAKELVWMRKLLSELGCEQKDATMLYVDNLAAISWGTEGVRNAKHVSIRVNFVKEQCDLKNINLLYCQSSEMPADVLTKPLSANVFENHRDSLSVLCMGTVRGGVDASTVAMHSTTV